MRAATGRLESGVRARRPRVRRPCDCADGLERRDLLTGGSVVGSGAYVMVMPTPTGTNVTQVSYQQHNGTTMIDVNLNGRDYYFSTAQVTSLYYLGNSASGPQTFIDSTRLTVTALGGSGTNLFVGGSGSDTFTGGSGSNTFIAGTGFDQMTGGAGTNVFYENATGSGVIHERGLSTIIVPPEQTGSYVVLPW